MSKRYTSVEGLFGQKIHYDENGNYAGESWPGLFDGSMEHYDTMGRHVGYSDHGVFADKLHYADSIGKVGETWSGIADGQKVHYGSEGYVGQSWDTLLGTSTDFDSAVDLFDGDF